VLVGCVLAHIARPLLQRPKREPIKPASPSSAPPAVERDWRLPGCTAACFGGRHHPLAHEAYGRRLAEQAAAAKLHGHVCTGPIVVDFDASCVLVDDVDVGVTHVEWLMISRLARELGALVTYGEMLDAVWQIDGGATSGRQPVERRASDPLVPQDIHIIRVNLTRLRQRLGRGAPLVRTIPSKGLILVAASPYGIIG